MHDGVVGQDGVVGVELAAFGRQDVGIVVVFAGEVTEVAHGLHLGGGFGAAVDQHFLDAEGFGFAREGERGVAPDVGGAEKARQVGVGLDLLGERDDQAVGLGVLAVALAERDVTAGGGEVIEHGARGAEDARLGLPGGAGGHRLASARQGDALHGDLGVVARFEEQQVAAAGVQVDHADPGEVEAVAAEAPARERLGIERVEVPVAVIGHGQDAMGGIEDERLQEGDRLACQSLLGVGGAGLDAQVGGGGVGKGEGEAKGEFGALAGIEGALQHGFARRGRGGLVNRGALGLGLLPALPAGFFRNADAAGGGVDLDAQGLVFQDDGSGGGCGEGGQEEGGEKQEHSRHLVESGFHQSRPPLRIAADLSVQRIKRCAALWSAAACCRFG